MRTRRPHADNASTRDRDVTAKVPVYMTRTSLSPCPVASSSSSIIVAAADEPMGWSLSAAGDGEAAAGAGVGAPGCSAIWRLGLSCPCNSVLVRWPLDFEMDSEICIAFSTGNQIFFSVVRILIFSFLYWKQYNARRAWSAHSWRERSCVTFSANGPDHDCCSDSTAMQLQRTICWELCVTSWFQKFC